ncbi:hypothetical protein ACE41H_14790 [Paenibacillus enshidis]|uniref:Uncharacterized protein n=1 Tax=Paenibacillus enshidis TaxID=1458439 RepID=A0ABV5AY14_9BACL
MPTQIQAYFKTEDEAEGARTSLQAYRTEHLEVGQLGGTLGRDKRLLIPFVPYNTVGSMNTGGARRQDLQDTPGLLDAMGVFSSEDNDKLRYVLSAQVNNADYEEIVRKLRANHAYVDRFDE